MVGHWKIINSSTYQFNKVQTRLVFDRLGDGPAPRVPPVVGILVIFLVISTLSVYYMFSIGLVVVGVGLKLMEVCKRREWLEFEVADRHPAYNMAQRNEDSTAESLALLQDTSDGNRALAHTIGQHSRNGTTVSDRVTFKHMTINKVYYSILEVPLDISLTGGVVASIRFRKIHAVID